MNNDDILSKKLSEVEERKKGYLARQVEASDREKTESSPTASGDTRPRAEELDASIGSLPARVPAAEPEDPLDRVYSWRKCSQDKRSWAEVQEEERATFPI